MTTQSSENKKPKLILVAGGSGSGKTYFVSKLMDTLTPAEAVLISQDNYYKNLSHLSLEERAEVNFDHPDSIDFPLIAEHMQLLKEGGEVHIPEYDFTTHTRKNTTLSISPKPFILLEGILILGQANLVDLADLTIFVDAPDDIRILRRIKRDISERGRTVDSVIKQYTETVRPMHQKFVEPSKANADLLVDGEKPPAEAIANVMNLIS